MHRASNTLIESLKKELAAQQALAKQSKEFQKKLAARDAELGQLQEQFSEISSSVLDLQNDKKALQAKLAASRTQINTTENSNTKTPASALRKIALTKSGMQGGVEAAQAAEVAQLKLELYADLTNLVLTNVKRTEESDVYDCIQTGRNGSEYPVRFLAEPQRS